MYRRASHFAVCLLLLAGSVWHPARAAEPFRYPEGKHDKAELKYVNGMPVLQVEGTPEQMGEAVGVLAMRPAQRMLDYPADLLKHFHMGKLWSAFAAAGKNMVQHFPDDYRKEMEAMADGARVERERVIVGNTLFDLKKLFACSALLVDAQHSATGNPLLGRNLDYPSLGYAHEYSLLTIYRPKNAKHAFVSVGFPGLVGCLSGMNDAGLSVAVLEVFQVKATEKKWFDATGLPYALCYRRLLEECTTIAEAKALLEKMKRTTTTNLVLADRQGIAVFEVTPASVVMRQPEKGMCVCTNHYCSQELRPFALVNVSLTKERFETLKKFAMPDDRLAPSDLHRSLHLVRNEKETLQTMVFEPATLCLHLAIGQCPSSGARLRTLELGPYLTPR